MKVSTSFWVFRYDDKKWADSSRSVENFTKIYNHFELRYNKEKRWTTSIQKDRNN
jgi:hypothetical protein